MKADNAIWTVRDGIKLLELRINPEKGSVTSTTYTYTPN